MKPYHPMRDDTPVVYSCSEPGKRKPFVAFFDNPKLPICFWADTYAQAHDAAVRFRDDAVERNEAEYLNRRAAVEKARASRKKKEATQ